MRFHFYFKPISSVLFTMCLYSTTLQSALAQSAPDCWDNLRQFPEGQKIEVIDMELRSVNGSFTGFTEEAISLRSDSNDISIKRTQVFRVTSHEASHRGRNTLIGLAIGAAGGAAVGAIGGSRYHEEGETGVFMLVGIPIGAGIGAGVGAVMPSGHKTIYRAKERVRTTAP